MDIPNLKNGQFAVGKAEYATGIVLKNDGTRFKTGGDLNEMYEIFDGYEGADEFALLKIKANPDIECWIVDSKGNHVITYDKNGQRKFSS